MPQTPSLPPACAAFAHILPLLTDAGGTGDSAAARAHVLTCPHCQRALADYQQIDAAMRRHYASYVPPTIRIEEIMRFLPDIRQRTASAAVRQPAMRQRWTMFSAVLVALVLILSSATFALLHSHQPSSRPKISQPAPIASDLALSNISMISPEEGWAIGAPYSVGWDLNLPSTLTNSTVYHYQHGAWRIEQLVVPTLIAARIEFLHMISPTDGWAIADAVTAPGATREVVMHYDGARWTPISLQGQVVPDSFREFNRFTGIQVLSDASIWMSMFALRISDGETQLPTVAHLVDGHTWHIEQLPLPPTIKGVNTNFTPMALAMVNDDEGWLAARVSGPTTNGGTGDVTLLYHRLHGKWAIDTTFTDTQIDGMSMLSQSDGWILGESTVTTTAAGAGPAPVFYRYVNNTWTIQTAGIAEIGTENRLNMISATNGWVFTNWSHAKAYHFAGNQWKFAQDLSALVKVANLGQVMITAAAFPSADEGWAIGYYTLAHSDSTYPLLFHYSNGLWSIVHV